ncbi:MAG: rRNA biogenesis protein [Methanosarcinales archaeon]|nr:rRNA biogenesis protein [ANME-2 cluster archaeon]MDF1531180.1 rRNA biogenesis protein [ANME-2 cluster archaeon]MDW7774854.1 rRNA biogenesis protein [Methanosarcinales archaeon]
MKNGHVLSCELYPKDVKTLVDRLQEVQTSLISDDLDGLDLRVAAKECGFVTSEEEYNALFHAVYTELAIRQITATRSNDTILVQSIQAMDDLDRITNALSERLKEMYDLNFPEIGLKGEKLVHFVSKHGTRNNVNHCDLEHKNIHILAECSTGMELPEAFANCIKDMASNIAGLYAAKDQISKFIGNHMERNYSNLSDVAGVHISARLISIAGGAQKLANMPSSTIQVLGAEKSLFKHLRGNATSPKHGVIFQHPLVREGPWWLRGKIARLVAAKISLAVRVDFYAGDFRKELAEDLNRKVGELYNKYPSPPKRKSGK